MGYTHYWTPKKPTQEQWNELLKEAKELHNVLPANTDTAGGYCSNDPLVIKGGGGEDEPEFSKEMIWLNGDRANDLDHETFMIAPDKDEWNFCKTARKPYDLLVCAILLAAHNVLGYEVSSDGDLEEWLPAIEFYSKVIYGTPKKIMSFNKELRAHILPDFLYRQSVEYKRNRRAKSLA